MATIYDLFRKVQTLVDDTIDNANMVDWFNQCQNNILDMLYLPTLKTVNRNETTGMFDVPTDCNGELKILVPNGIDIYSIYDNAIYFDGSDSDTIDYIQITYNRIPNAIENDPESIPDIPAQLHDVYVCYACMMYCEMEEDDRYENFEKEYLRMRGQIQKYMGKMRPKPANWKVVR